MKVYAIEYENAGYPEDRQRSLHWVGVNEEEAYRILEIPANGYTYFSIWEAGQNLSEYSRQADTNGDGLGRGITTGKWERNSGATNERLEAQHVSQAG
jgi:hypothetical protein